MRKRQIKDSRKQDTRDATRATHKRIESNRTKALIAIGVVVIMAGIPFCLGKYFEFNSPDPFDSGCYVYSAKHVLSGARVGYEEKPSAQMGTLLLNMLGVSLFGFNETGPKLLQMLFQLGALVLMFVTVRRLFGLAPAAVSVIVASVYLSAPLIAKFGNVKEQFMIAFMVIGISCVILHQLTGKWWLAVIAGGLLAWGPMFKQTGLSAIAATGLFVLLQPVLGHNKWRQMGKDIVLLALGAIISTGPVILWLVSMKTPVHFWPYSFVLEPALSILDKSPANSSTAVLPDKDATGAVQQKKGLWYRLLPGYVTDSWDVLSPAERKETSARVFRYYSLLILPISLALGSLAMRLGRWIYWLARHRQQQIEAKSAERFVLLLAVWWFFDMAFVWISPHSYEQYYLPLNASSAMLGGYIVGLYWDRASREVVEKRKWILIGIAGVVVMTAMAWHIFFGITRRPHSGMPYPAPSRGYQQRYVEISDRLNKNLRGEWEYVSEYIRTYSQPTDTIYVWGWFPGIYVAAQRFSVVPEAFEGMMHIRPPDALAKKVQEILTIFEKQPPKFIVDSRKQHFPFNRPPLELWPQTQKGFLPVDKTIVDEYDTAYAKLLREKFADDEAQRYAAMKPFRQYVMNNYKVVGPFAEHVVLQRR